MKASNTKWKWVSSERQFADGLTKNSARQLLADRLRVGQIGLKHDPDFVASKKKDFVTRAKAEREFAVSRGSRSKMMQAFQAFLVMQAFGSIEAANPDSPINDPTVHVIIVTWPLVVMWCVTALSLVITAFVCGRFHRTQPTAQASPPTPPRVQDLNCLTCGEYGHGARTCPMRRVPPPPSEPESGEEEASPEAEAAPPPKPEEEQPPPAPPPQAPPRPAAADPAPPPAPPNPQPNPGEPWHRMRALITFGRYRGDTYADACADPSYSAWIGSLDTRQKCGRGLEEFREFLWDAHLLPDPRRPPPEEVD